MNDNLDNFYNPQIYEDLGCTLQISGVGFDAAAFLKESGLMPEDVLFFGALGVPDEVIARVEKESQKTQILSIFNSTVLLISISREADLSLQVKDAATFLKRYENELKKIQSYLSIEMTALKFISETKSDFNDFSPEFYDLIAEIGIENVMLG